MPSSLVGSLLALLLVGSVLASAWLIIRKPGIAIGVLVAGMAFHNFVVMVLLRLGTPGLLIRAVQGWKEFLLALLTVIVIAALIAERRRGSRLVLMPVDWVAIAFFIALVVFTLLPGGLLGGHANLLQRLAAFRIDALIPLLYLLGRVSVTFVPDQMEVTTWLIVGAGAVVGAFGLYELWLVPTRVWLDWGINLFSSWLGFVYKGPAGLPENFFQTLPDGLLLRRMVSTYLSPLGIAYTGILVWPLATILLAQPKKSRTTALVAGLAVALLLVGIMLSVTRLAIAMVVIEAILIGLLIRSRLAWSMAAAVVVLAAAALFLYPLVGPVVDPYLLPGVSRENYLFSAGDPSFQEHIRQLGIDLRLFAQRPIGAGLGASLGRFATPTAGGAVPGESAVLGVFIDVGVLGGLLYALLYGYGVYAGWRAFRKSGRRWLAAGFPLVAFAGGLALIPITMTSDVWGDFSVTFLFWFAAGCSVTMAWHPLFLRDDLEREVAPLALGGELRA